MLIVLPMHTRVAGAESAMPRKKMVGRVSARRGFAPGMRDERRGIILLIVLSMLALFAIVGLSFVSYADSSATTAMYYRQGADQNSRPVDVEPELTTAFFIGQFIYGPRLDNAGLNSALRGHDL